MSGFGGSFAKKADNGEPWVPAWHHRYIGLPLIVIVGTIVAWKLASNDGSLNWPWIIGIILVILLIQYVIIHPIYFRRRRTWERENQSTDSCASL
ncbi:MAG: hypothetical protein Q4F64_00620 [Corynebacterium casei]|nr:hypothetical protein [Corynebacterium casei]